MKLRWDKWFYGLFSGFIGGGAGACAASVTAAVIAPAQFNPVTQLKNFLIMAASTFLVNGLMSIFFYLKQSPLPTPEETTFITKPTEPPTL